VLEMTEYYSKPKLQLQMKCGKALKGSLIIFDLDIMFLLKEKGFFKIFGFCIILFNYYFWMNFNFIPKKLVMFSLNNKKKKD
jgi:hypothetical protein